MPATPEDTKLQFSALLKTPIVQKSVFKGLTDFLLFL